MRHRTPVADSKRFNRTPLTKEQKEIAEENFHLIRQAVKLLARSFRSLHEDDMVSVGNEVLVVAARKWNPQNGTTFAWYAMKAFKYHFRRTSATVHNTIYLPRQDKGQETKTKTYLLAREAAYHVQHIDLYDICAKKQEHKDYEPLYEAMRHLTERQRDAVESMIMSNQTLKEFGKRHGIGRERARQIRESALAKLRTIMVPQKEAS